MVHYQPLLDVTTGDGWSSVSTGGAAWVAKARHGGHNTYELEVGNGPGDRDEADFEAFRATGTYPFALEYDSLSGAATLDVDGTTASHGVVTGLDGAVSITAKAPAAGRVLVSDLALNGETLHVDVDADATGSATRVLRHAVVDGAQSGLGFTLTGIVDVDLDSVAAGDLNDETPAFQIEVERA